MINVCPRCRSKELEERPLARTAKCSICSWEGPVADCLAVTRDGLVLEKVMERMVHRLSSHVGRGLAQGVVDFAHEYGIRVRREDLQRIVVRIIGQVLKSLHEELMSLAPKDLQNKVRTTNRIIAADEDPVVPTVELPLSPDCIQPVEGTDE